MTRRVGMKEKEYYIERQKDYTMDKVYNLIDVLFTDEEKKELNGYIKNRDKKGTTMMLLPVFSYLRQQGYNFIRAEHE